MAYYALIKLNMDGSVTVNRTKANESFLEELSQYALLLSDSQEAEVTIVLVIEEE